MKREALAKLNRLANESGLSFGTVQPSQVVLAQFRTQLSQWGSENDGVGINNWFEINRCYGGRDRTRTCDLLRVKQAL